MFEYFRGDTATPSQIDLLNVVPYMVIVAITVLQTLLRKSTSVCVTVSDLVIQSGIDHMDVTTDYAEYTIRSARVEDPQGIITPSSTHSHQSENI